MLSLLLRVIENQDEFLVIEALGAQDRLLRLNLLGLLLLLPSILLRLSRLLIRLLLVLLDTHQVLYQFLAVTEVDDVQELFGNERGLVHY
jgi:hypothetical protein